MVRRNQDREVVYVEAPGDSSAKWLFWGALLGAGLALLYAPRSGEETRRHLQRKLWKFRAMTEEKLDELAQQLSREKDAFEESEGEPDDLDEEAERTVAGLEPRSGTSPREALERRLAEARSRRRAAAELEEPHA